MKEYESVTQDWIKETVAAGSGAGVEGQEHKGEKHKEEKEKGKEGKEGKETPLQSKRTELAQQLRTGYWQLDPYLRAKTLYDRLGIIREGGKIQFYDSEASHGDVDLTAKNSTGANAGKVTGGSNAQNQASATGGGGNSGGVAGHRDHDLD